MPGHCHLYTLRQDPSLTIVACCTYSPRSATAQPVHTPTPLDSSLPSPSSLHTYPIDASIPNKYTQIDPPLPHPPKIMNNSSTILDNPTECLKSSYFSMVEKWKINPVSRPTFGSVPKCICLYSLSPVSTSRVDGPC